MHLPLRLTRLFLVSCFLTSCSPSPYSYEIPQDPMAWDLDEEFKEAVSELSVEEQILLKEYLQRTSALIFFGTLPPKSTIGQALQNQRNLILRQSQEEKRIERRQWALEKYHARLYSAKRALSITLQYIDFIPSNYLQKQNTGFVIVLDLRNHTDNQMTSIQGVLVFTDPLGEEITRFPLNVEKPLRPRRTITIHEFLEYHYSGDPEDKLQNLTLSDIQVFWEPMMYVYADGSTLEVGDPPQ